MIGSLYFSQKYEKMDLNYFQLSKHVGKLIVSISAISYLALNNEVLGLVTGLLISLLLIFTGRLRTGIVHGQLNLKVGQVGIY